MLAILTSAAAAFQWCITSLNPCIIFIAPASSYAAGDKTKPCSPWDKSVCWPCRITDWYQLAQDLDDNLLVYILVCFNPPCVLCTSHTQKNVKGMIRSLCLYLTDLTSGFNFRVVVIVCLKWFQGRIKDCSNMCGRIGVPHFRACVYPNAFHEIKIAYW